MSTPALKPAAIPTKPTTIPAAKPVAARKPSISTVKSPSIRKETDKTTPYVLMRKPTTTQGKATRQIVNFIEVGDTKEASHVRPIRVAVVNGYTFGTNFPSTVTSLKGARVFAYSTVQPHGLTAAKVQPWSRGNEDAIRALELLGLITKYELEFHLAETTRLKDEDDAAAKAKAKQAQAKTELAALTDLAKAAVKAHGLSAVRTALIKGHKGLL